MVRRKEQGMTLMEIMIVVLIISLLAALAFPALRKIREASQNTRFVADLRIAVNAFEQKAFEPGGLPPDEVPGVVPLGMDAFLSRMDWTSPTPIDGQWDWYPAAPGFGNAVVVILSTTQDSRLADVDNRLDDGDLASGLFRKIDATTYGFLVE